MGKDLSINLIDNLLHFDTGYPDYYGMIMFGTQKWYTHNLWKLLITKFTNWENFVKIDEYKYANHMKNC